MRLHGRGKPRVNRLKGWGGQEPTDEAQTSAERGVVVQSPRQRRHEAQVEG